MTHGWDCEAAVIKGCYADYRRVKGRKVLQLIVEVPLEAAPKVHEAFGEPTPDGSTWVAVALLDTKASQTNSKPENKHQLSRQAALCCNDKRFWAFLHETYMSDAPPINSVEQAAEVVREICVIDSRAELDRDDEAAARWRNWYGKFQAWLNV